jgi:YggT family protein
MTPIILLIIRLLDIYLWIIIATILVSWLVAFDVLNTRNKWVYKACDLMNRVTNPPLRRLRKIIPPMGGIDLSPMALMLGIYLVQSFLYGLLR